MQGKESVTFCEIGHLTQALKGDSLAEDGSCHQQCKGVRRKSIQPGADDFAHTGWEEPADHCLMLHGCRKVNGPSAIVVRVRGEHAALEQHLERFHRIASRKSSFLLFKLTCSHDVAPVFPPRLQPRSLALEQERNMAFVREKEEDV